MPTTPWHGGNPKPTNPLNNANNIWQGGNPKPTCTMITGS